MRKTLLFLFLSVYAMMGMAADDDADYEFMYRLTYQVDTVTGRTSEALMTLRTNQHKSLFYAQAQYELDSLMEKATGDAEAWAITDSVKSRYGRINVFYYVLKDFDSSELQFQDNVMRDYRYTESIPEFAWSFTDEKKNVGEYECQKAVCSYAGRTYEAWFTPDIPTSDGPWKFRGLPGLILEVRSTDGHYLFELLGMRPCKGKIAIPTEDFVKTTKKKLITMQQKLIDDPNALFDIAKATMGIVVTGPKAPKRKSYATMERLEHIK